MWLLSVGMEQAESDLLHLKDSNKGKASLVIHFLNLMKLSKGWIKSADFLIKSDVELENFLINFYDGNPDEFSKTIYSYQQHKKASTQMSFNEFVDLFNLDPIDCLETHFHRGRSLF